MKWSIPAKTFLVGEYVAMMGAPAIVLTTTPCFEVTLTSEPGFQGVHKEAPVSRWWQGQNHQLAGLLWQDPYDGMGGLGASSAQFLGAYLANQFLREEKPQADDLLASFEGLITIHKGARPSGYDLLAQFHQGCVYLDRRKHHYESHPWPFQELAFLLVHTGQKLATHQHLETLTLPDQMEVLVALVEQARKAFEDKKSEQLVAAVNGYHEALHRMHLVADHSLTQMASLRSHSDVLAVKGCGAMGADVIVILVPMNKLASVSRRVTQQGFRVVGSNLQLYYAHS